MPSPIHTLVTAAAIACVAQACNRLDLDSQDPDELDEQALRITQADSVVLCPLSAAIGPSGAMSMVWAGYPPADDRLQLMHAQVSQGGSLAQSPHSIALLDSELVALDVAVNEAGLVVRAIEDNAEELLAFQLDGDGALIDASRGGLELLPSVADSCQVTVQAGTSKLSVFLTQVDGEVPLFVRRSM